MASDPQEDKFAPRRVAALFGHQAAEAAVLAGYRARRLHHAWLITGPRGIGKATLAYRFARFLLATDDSRDEAARTDLRVAEGSPAFRLVASSGHPDLLCIEREWDDERKRLRAEITVKQIRRIAEFMHLTPSLGGWRVVIVDAADEMNRTAANSLLKILEEPPRQAILLLVCHAPGQLLPTIRSRCRRLALAPLSADIVGTLLDERQPKLSVDDRDLLIRLGDGSVGRALAIAESGGVGLYREIAAQFGNLPAVDMGSLHGLADRLAKNGAEAAFRLGTEVLLSWLGDMVRRAAAAPATRSPPGFDGAFLDRLARRADLDRWLELWDKTTHLFERTESVNLDRKQVWIAAMLDVAETIGADART